MSLSKERRLFYEERQEYLPSLEQAQKFPLKTQRTLHNSSLFWQNQVRSFPPEIKTMTLVNNTPQPLWQPRYFLSDPSLVELDVL